MGRVNDRSMSKESDKQSSSFFERIGFGKHSAASEEEIKDLVDDTPELLPDEKRMIHEIIDLGDMTVREIMTPRVDMICVEDTENVHTALERMRGTGFSRLPVYHEDLDRIVGIAYYKELMGPMLDNRAEDPVSKYMFTPLFVPETKDIFPLLSEMQLRRQQIAIVVDEYGGTDGLITIEDIVEEIVGEIVDETDLEDKYITELNDNTWLVDGRMPIEEAVALGWPVEDSEDYETLAGWLMDMMDAMPVVGDEYVAGDYTFKITGMRRHRILAVRVIKH